MNQDEQTVLKIINRLGKEDRAKENGDWVMSGWILHALGTEQVPMHPNTLIQIARSLEKQGWIIIDRKKRKPRKKRNARARPFCCKMNPARNKRVKR